MEKYDYFEAVKNDVKDYIYEQTSLGEIDLDDYKGNPSRLEEEIYEHLWDVDSVTGNGSASYTFSSWIAEEYLCHNWGLLAEALCDLGYEGVNPIEKGAEWCDVIIRCYLLAGAISKAVEELDLDEVDLDNKEDLDDFDSDADEETLESEAPSAQKQSPRL